MIVDSSIWIDHLRAEEPGLDALLIGERALMHPHVLGEVGLGSIRDRTAVIDRFLLLPVPNVAGDGHVLSLIDEHGLWSTGLGFTDAHLVASALITPNALIWTRDKRLRRVAERLDILAGLD